MLTIVHHNNLVIISMTVENWWKSIHK